MQCEVDIKVTDKFMLVKPNIPLQLLVPLSDMARFFGFYHLMQDKEGLKFVK